MTKTRIGLILLRDVDCGCEGLENGGCDCDGREFVRTNFPSLCSRVYGIDSILHVTITKVTRFSGSWEMLVRTENGRVLK